MARRSASFPRSAPSEAPASAGSAGEAMRKDSSDLMRGARNCVNGYCAIQPEERVLLWLDRTDKLDTRVVEALARAIDETGAPLSIPKPKFPSSDMGRDCQRLKRRQSRTPMS